MVFFLANQLFTLHLAQTGKEGKKWGKKMKDSKVKTSTGVQILIVEDEIIVARDIEDKLQKLGYHVPDIASSGEEAIEKASDIRPDLVLMDITLEGDMDGVEAAEQIVGQYNLPVVYLTAHTDLDTLFRARYTEPYGYIIKPYTKGFNRHYSNGPLPA